MRTSVNDKYFLAWFIWLLGALFYFYENLLQVSPAVMTHDLMQFFSIDETKLSILASCYFYAYAFIQIPAGILIDNYKIKYVLLCAVFFCVVGCFLFLMSSTVYEASFGRFFIGLGSGFAAISAMKLATSWFSAKKFPFLVGLMVTLGMSGSIVGEGPLAVVVEKFGWQQSMLYLGLAGVALFILIALVVKENPFTLSKVKKTSQQGIFTGVKEIIVCKNSWALAIYAGLMFAPTVILGGLWGVPFLMEFYKIQKTVAASIVSLLFLGWVIGSPCTGFLATYYDRKKVMLYGTIGTFLTIMLILYHKFDSLGSLSVCVFLFGFLSSCFLPAFSVIKDLHKPQNSGVVLGFMNTANTLGGALGLSFIGLLFKVNWDHWFGTTINAILNYQIVLGILPLMIFISTCIMSLLFSGEKLESRQADVVGAL